MNDPRSAPRAKLSQVIATYANAELHAKHYATGDVELYEDIRARGATARLRHVATRNKGSRFWWVLLGGAWSVAQKVPMFDDIADADDMRGEITGGPAR